MDIASRATKVCFKCKQAKPRTAFNKDSGKRDGLHSYCRECSCTGARASSKRNYDSAIAWGKHIKRTYGITAEEYVELYNKQGGVCACCGKKESLYSPKRDKTFQLAVDHDHVTGEVRALLCSACNTALGALEEDPERIEALLRYARRLKP
jgi:Recombination endonuclease VII